MFIPLSIDDFYARIKVLAESQNPPWDNFDKSSLAYMAKKPKYREIVIQKRCAERNILIGGEAAPPKVRIIHAPSLRLKKIQSYILDMILNPASDMLSRCAQGCIPGTSTVTNAQPHIGARVRVHMDLKDFFPSINVRRVYALFRRVFKYKMRLAWLLANLCCYQERLPQGAPTSPMLANMVATPMDWNLNKLVRAMGGSYTRYVDDLNFSFRRWLSRSGRERFIKTVTEIAARHGFTVNAEKTGVATQRGRISVTGIVVNQKLSTPREFRANLRAAFHNRAKGLPCDDSHETAKGKLAYVSMVAPDQVKSVLGKAAGQ